MRAVVLLCLFTASAPAAEPITRLAQLPAIDQQKDDFYGALAIPGKSIKATWTLPEQLSTSADSPLTLTLTNVLNPDDLRPPDLANRPEFQRLFTVIESPSRVELDIAANTVKIVTSVRPRNSGKLSLSELKFVYYLPQARRFQTTYAEAITRTVTVAVAPPPLPLDGPPNFFTVREPTRSYPVPSWGWWALPLMLVCAATAFVLWHRKRYPQSAERARILRIRAVRVALRDLRRLPGEAPAEVLSSIWQRYLVARYGVAPTANTPQELADELARLKFPSNRATQATAMIEQLHAAQFGPTVQAVSPLPLRQLIETWEGLPA
jgi:hypothetical protein